MHGLHRALGPSTMNAKDFPDAGQYLARTAGAWITTYSAIDLWQGDCLWCPKWSGRPSVAAVLGPGGRGMKSHTAGVWNLTSAFIQYLKSISIISLVNQILISAQGVIRKGAYTVSDNALRGNKRLPFNTCTLQCLSLSFAFLIISLYVFA